MLPSEMVLSLAPAPGADAYSLITGVLGCPLPESHLLNDQVLKFSSNPGLSCLLRRGESDSQVGRLTCRVLAWSLIPSGLTPARAALTFIRTHGQKKKLSGFRSETR